MEVSQGSGISGDHFLSSLFWYDCLIFILIMYYLYNQEINSKAIFIVKQ